MADQINQKPMKALAISIAEIKNLYDELKIKIDEVIRAELIPITSLALSEEEKNEINIKIIEAYKLEIVFTTKHNGLIILKNDTDPFNNTALNDQLIEAIHIKCTPNLGGAWSPKAAFEIFFDFSTHSIFNWNNSGVSDPTLNNSAYRVYGAEDTYRSAILKKIEDFLNRKSTNRNWLHASNIYDIGLWFIIIPFAILKINELSSFIKSYFNNDPVLVMIIYVYSFVLIIWIYRLLVGYTKWLWPKVELKDNSHGKTHRALQFAIVGGLLVNAVLEILSIFLI